MFMATTAKALNNVVDKMTWLHDVSQSLSLTTPVLHDGRAVMMAEIEPNRMDSYLPK